MQMSLRVANSVRRLALEKPWARTLANAHFAISRFEVQQRSAQSTSPHAKFRVAWVPPRASLPWFLPGKLAFIIVRLSLAGDSGAGLTRRSRFRQRRDGTRYRRPVGNDGLNDGNRLHKLHASLVVVMPARSKCLCGRHCAIRKVRDISTVSGCARRAPPLSHCMRIKAAAAVMLNPLHCIEAAPRRKVFHRSPSEDVPANVVIETLSRSRCCPT